MKYIILLSLLLLFACSSYKREVQTKNNYYYPDCVFGFDSSYMDDAKFIAPCDSLVIGDSIKLSKYKMIE